MYYVYKLIDHRTELPFYIGKGSGNRKGIHVNSVKNNKVSENRYKDKVIRDIFLETGYYPASVIVKEFENEHDAYEYETMLIEEYGVYKEGGLLTNILKENAPPNHTGKKRSKETIEKLADRCGEKNPMWGKKQTDAAKEKISKGTAGKNNPFYKKTGKDHPVTGYKHSEEECKARSNRNKIRWQDEEYAAKIVKNLDRSKTWDVKDPNGNKYTIKNLMEFSKQMNEPWHKIRNSRGGWKCTPTV